MSLGWSDIFLQEPEFDFRGILEQWSPLVEGQLQPLGLSAFGDFYFLRPDGAVHVLDVIEGAVRCCIPCDHIPLRSWPLVRARDVMRGLIETLKAKQAT